MLYELQSARTVGHHLPPALQLDGDEPPKPAMEEEQVDVIFTPIDSYAFLPVEEGEIVAKLGDEVLQLGQYCRFQVVLGIVSVKAQVVEKVGIAEH